MRTTGTLKVKHFTPFLSVAEEAAASAREAWSPQGGHLHASSGRIVQTPHAAEPYKVVFDHGDGPDTEQPCKTIRECEALIKRRTPTPSLRNTSRDSPARPI